jgi:hypothetical protein
MPFKWVKGIIHSDGVANWQTAIIITASAKSKIIKFLGKSSLTLERILQGQRQPCRYRASFFGLILLCCWCRASLVVIWRSFSASNIRFSRSRRRATVVPRQGLFDKARGSLVFAGLTNLNQSNQISHHGFVNKIVDKLVNHNLTEEY